MDQPRTNMRYNYVISMIKSSTYEDVDLLETLFSEDPCYSKSLFYFIRKASVCSDYVDPDMNPLKAYRIFIDAISEYLLAYSTSRTIKSRLYDRLYKWCAHVGEHYKIANYQCYLNDIPKQITTDLTVELIKDLHDRKGVSKEELSDKYSVSKKKIQVCLHKLTDKACSDPLSIGGQSVYVTVSHKDEKHRTDKRHYYTPNTMSPVIFQLNLMQVATLLQSFQLNYDAGNNIPLDLAVDTWAQLSSYARERIREIFCKRDPAFSIFLDIVEEAENSDSYRFMTESELIRRGEASPAETLDMAAKSGGVYHLSLTQPFRTRKNQRIFSTNDRNKFCAVPADDLSAKPTHFYAEELRSIERAF